MPSRPLYSNRSASSGSVLEALNAGRYLGRDRIDADLIARIQEYPISKTPGCWSAAALAR